MKFLPLPVVMLFVLSACATPQVPEVHFLWQGKPGEALLHFGSADAAQAALDQAVAACNFDIHQTAAGDIADETGLNKACMASKGWLPDR